MSDKMLHLAVTQGDPAGVGPEIILRMFAEGGFEAGTRPFVVGIRSHFEQVLEVMRTTCEIPLLEHMQTQVFDRPPEEYGPNTLPIIEPAAANIPENIVAGEISGQCGATAWACIRHGVEMVRHGQAAGIVTAPIHKEALKAAGCPFPGHTEMLADMAGGAEMAMLLAGGGLRVALATIHEPISRVPYLLGEAKLIRLI
ncbi:MAG: 4-hydroxythreonine-4-phosphate dehydrogenase PdxA, partial [Candidatus Sumerlaeota bacterium]